MKCSNYCDGYCFYHGDTGEVCDKIEWGTMKKIKDGYCPREEDNRRAEEMAKDYIEYMEKENNNDSRKGT